ncbi:MAG TPA: subclass B3 metallo-beta-lactamase [Vicinamibacterales bacterium]|nr:subclass B3 metallo-beta-lactamase [Vicinamibacterales bacterium]
MTAIKIALAAAALAVSAQTLTPDNQPIEPFRIADHLYYVGSSDIASYLITTSAGDILIDAGYPQTAPQIERNVEKVGARIRDIKILLNTQAHFDHAGGFAALKRASGAQLLASDADALMLESGGRGDFALGDSGRFPPVVVDRRLADEEHVTLGDADLTAHLTPGHTRGCTTWTWDAVDRGRTYHVVDLCGLTILPATKVTGMAAYPNIANDYRHTFHVLRGLKPDIFLGAHLSYFGGAAKVATLRAQPDGPNPFVDAEGYRRFVEAAEKRFTDQLARESGQS